MTADTAIAPTRSPGTGLRQRGNGRYALEAAVDLATARTAVMGRFPVIASGGSRPLPIVRSCAPKGIHAAAVHRTTDVHISGRFARARPRIGFPYLPARKRFAMKKCLSGYLGAVYIFYCVSRYIVGHVDSFAMGEKMTLMWGIVGILIAIGGLCSTFASGAKEMKGIFLPRKFVSLGVLVGKSKEEIISVAGQPNHVSTQPNGKMLLQWISKGYHIALLFDGEICEAVTHESTSNF